MQTKLILVDGMPGTGKSTISQFIHHRSSANGRPSRWCYEEATHPVRLFYQPKTHLKASDYTDEVWAHWHTYAHSLHRQDQIAVLDAGLLETYVRSMLIFDLDRSAIYDLVRRIESLIFALDPVLIYLRPKNVETNFRDVVDVRSQQMLDLWIKAHDHYPYTRRAQKDGHAGFIAFWNEFGEISDRIFESLSIRKLQLDVANDDWTDRYSKILNFLDLPASSCSSPAPDLQRYCGQYAPVDDDTAPGFTLRAEEQCLILTSDQPTIDVQRGPIGCIRELRLIPKRNNRFYVQAWPHEVQFDEDETGTITKMQLSVSDAASEPKSEVYTKKP